MVQAKEGRRIDTREGEPDVSRDSDKREGIDTNELYQAMCRGMDKADARLIADLIGMVDKAIPRLEKRMKLFEVLHKEFTKFNEFIELREAKKIPEDARFITGELHIDDKEAKDLSFQLALLPNGDMKVLEAGDDIKLIKPGQGTPIGGRILTIEVRDIIPEGYKKCPNCGVLFQKEGKRRFCSDYCRTRWHAREWYRKNRSRRRKVKEK